MYRHINYYLDCKYKFLTQNKNKKILKIEVVYLVTHVVSRRHIGIYRTYIGAAWTR